MSIWLVFPAAKLAVVQNAYAAGGVKDGETIGTVVYDRTGAMCFTGSSRITLGQSDSIGVGNAPWLEIHENDAFMDTWDWPEPGP